MMQSSLRLRIRVMMCGCDSKLAKRGDSKYYRQPRNREYGMTTKSDNSSPFGWVFQRLKFALFLLCGPLYDQILNF